MNWRQLLRNRDFHAAWIGALMLALVIFFGDVRVWVLGVMAIAGIVLLIQWLIAVLNGKSHFDDPN